MPTQVIDLRSFVLGQLRINSAYDASTITPGELSSVDGMNLSDVESQDAVQEDANYNSDGEYYILVGYNKVGDGQ